LSEELVKKKKERKKKGADLGIDLETRVLVEWLLQQKGWKT
jgi:hypothetical protein